MSFEALATVQPDIVLKVVFIFVGEGAAECILIPVQVGLHCGQLKLALVHLEGEADLTALLDRVRLLMLVEERVDALGLRMEQKASKNSLPCDIVLQCFCLDDVQEDFEALFKLCQAFNAQVRQ